MLNKLRAYPAAGFILAVFAIYCLLRVANSHSLVLLLLTIVNIIVIISLRFGYKRLTANINSSKKR